MLAIISCSHKSNVKSDDVEYDCSAGTFKNNGDDVVVKLVEMGTHSEKPISVFVLRAKTTLSKKRSMFSNPTAFYIHSSSGAIKGFASCE